MFRKLRNLIFYCKTLKKNLKNLQKHFVENSQNKPYKIIDIKLDHAYRLYTVINFKPKTQEEMRKYGYYYMDKEVKSFIKDINDELAKIGLYEFVGLSRADQISEFSVFIVIEYKFMKTTKFFKRLLYSTISIFLISLLSLFLLF